MSITASNQGKSPAAVLKDIREKHNDFLTFLKALTKDANTENAPESDLSPHLAPSDKAIYAKTLGVPCKASWRAVAVDGVLKAMEYTFFSEFEGKNEPVWSMYLGVDRVLYKDARMTERLGEYDDEKIAASIIAGLTNGMLKSRVFLPRNSAMGSDIESTN